MLNIIEVGLLLQVLDYLALNKILHGMVEWQRNYDEDQKTIKGNIFSDGLDSKAVIDEDESEENYFSLQQREESGSFIY